MFSVWRNEAHVYAQHLGTRDSRARPEMTASQRLLGGIRAGAHAYQAVCALQLSAAAAHGDLKAEAWLFGWALEKTSVDGPKAERMREMRRIIPPT